MRYFGFSELGREQEDPAIATTQRCEHQGCALTGEFRAPKSPHEMDSYYWFCLEHVRSYNADWDFFAGMDQNEIEAFRRSDLVGHRPTWRLGVSNRAENPIERAMRDSFAPSGAERAAAAAEPPKPKRPRWNSGPERRALEVLELDAKATFAEVKSRYKDLVKRLHPDANGGARDAEERLKTVTQAYSLLRKRAATPVS